MWGKAGTLCRVGRPQGGRSQQQAAAQKRGSMRVTASAKEEAAHMPPLAQRHVRCFCARRHCSAPCCAGCARGLLALKARLTRAPPGSPPTRPQGIPRPRPTVHASTRMHTRVRKRTLISAGTSSRCRNTASRTSKGGPWAWGASE
jgi:hypothetical protein